MTKRWSETQHLVAAYFAGHGWPYADAVGNGRDGVDVTGVPGLAIEVKAEDGWRPTTWLKQATSHVTPLIVPGMPVVPLVVQRPKGFGEASIRQWPMLLPLMHGVRLLRAAGYGDQDDDD